MSVSLAFTLAGWVLLNLFLLASLAGFAIQTEQTVGSRLWASAGILAVFFLSNAVLLDQYGPRFHI